MKTSKSTGSDGLTAEFLKFFWNNLKYFIISAINGILIKKTITNITEAWYNFSFTKGGDKTRQFMKNLRPITLLNGSFIRLYKL